MIGPKPLPSCPEAERELLGWILGSPYDKTDVLAMLRADDFHDAKHVKIYEAASELNRARQTIDLVTLAAKMRSLGTLVYLGAFGCEEYLAGLVAECGFLGTEHALAHAKLVLDAARRRSVILASAALVERAYSGELSSAQLIEQFQSQLGSLADRSHAKVPRPFRELLHGTLKKIEARFSAPRKSAVCGIPTGLIALDDLTQGYQPSEVFVIGARPSMGKTSFVLKSVFHAAEKGFPVLVFSLEMSEDETALRSLSAQSSVNSARLKTGMMDTADWIKITKASSRIAPLPIMVDDDGSQSVETLCAKARKWRRDPAVFADPQHMGLVVVDYVQLIPPSKHGKSQLNRDQQVTEIFRQLKALAKEIRCPLLLVVSLSRKCEERQDKRPIPSDIRDSGNIESDADTICMLYRDEVYKPDTDDKGIAEFIIRKARNGATGTVRARWYADTTSFDDER